MTTYPSHTIPLCTGPDGVGGKLQATDGSSGQLFAEDNQNLSGRWCFVCIPGIGDVRSSYRFMAEHFGKQHRVIVADIRGFGDSGVGDFPAFTPETVACDYARILDHFQVRDNAILVGNSLAAGSALMTASSHPAVAGAVLLGPVVRDSPADKWFRPLSHVLFCWPWGAPVWDSFYGTLYKRPERPSGFADHVQANKTSIRARNGLRSTGKFMRASKKGVEQTVAIVAKPVLVLMGDQDPDYADPIKEEAWLKTTMTKARLTTVMLESVGHYPHVEAAPESMQHIESFLKSL